VAWLTSTARTGTNSDGKTVLSRMALLEVREGVPKARASDNPRKGMRPASIYRTYSYSLIAAGRTRKTTRYTKE
jgi:hypothetical protein